MNQIDILNALYLTYTSKDSNIILIRQRSIEVVSKEPPQNFEITTLENYKHKAELLNLFEKIPPREIQRCFGLSTVLWAGVNSHSYIWSEYLEEIIPSENLRTGNKSLIGRAKKLHSSEQTIEEFLQTYERLIRFDLNLIKPLDLEKIIIQTAKGEMSSERAKQYSLKTEIPNNKNYGYVGNIKRKRNIWYFENAQENKQIELFIDSPFGIVLYYKEEPQAALSFEINRKVMLIRQLQGLKATPINSKKPIKRKSRRGLGPLNWKETLVLIAAVYAKNQGIETMGIQSGQNNEWVRDTLLSRTKAEEIYDITAKKLGFVEKIMHNVRPDFYRTVRALI